ncbi:gp6-like head-tail connector protein [Natranaerovirga pectinivora]|uniref:Gp6-like head-tail connector protein n=1 Tax=Natranaerovirga pectinivora TaxID=682400 RepID=A0A4R3MJJ8_9FIRM|nr:head-tail connector protein [Natranaerovirga pectinivora]TCT14579.1 gp6-like head-tail connector protein [Natranaerovirga pectinivora]
MLTSLEDIKLYLRVEGDEEDTLITSFILTAQEMCEDILRFKLEELQILPEQVKQAIFYAVGNMYEERERASIKEVYDVIKRLLSSYRKESW